jgi:chemotaxis protein MotB
VKGQIIIKKRRKGAHAGAHGGSWKVAYADFVTAMMAFFLLMWLVTMTSPEQKVAISNYINKVTVFEALGMSSIIRGEQSAVRVIEPARDPNALPGKRAGGGILVISKEKLKEQLKQQVELRLAEMKEQVIVDVFEGGVRVQIMDQEGNPMFSSGSVQLTPKAKDILAVIIDNIKGMENVKVAVEGHTDSVSYLKGKYTNWELSTDRASSARIEIEKDGFPSDRITRVSGFASTDPLVREDTKDPRNRRISLLIYQDMAGKRVEKSGDETSKDETPKDKIEETPRIEDKNRIEDTKQGEGTKKQGEGTNR